MNDRRLALEQLTDTNADLYEVPEGKQRVMTDINICNTSTQKVGVWLYVVPNDDTADDDTAFIFGYEIPAKGVFRWKGRQTLSSLEKIIGRASIDSALTVLINGEDSI